MEEDNIKVRRWSFCPKCGGRGINLPCEVCNGTGKVFELVLLKDISRLIKPEYRKSQADFIKEQLDGKIKV